MRAKSLFGNITYDEAIQLIKNGEDVNQLNSYNRTPLYYATSPNIMELLIKNGAAINIKDIDDYTPLHAHTDNFKNCKMLIDAGADINAINNVGRSPIFYVGNTDIAQLFINKGINLNKKFKSTLYLINEYNPYELNSFFIKNGAVPQSIDCYNHYKYLFSKEQQHIFDIYKTITNNDDDFFAMCLAYNSQIKNTIEIMDLNIQ